MRLKETIPAVTANTAGDAAERRARHAAATLGVADFVYTQPVVHTGSGVREVGDGLLVCSGRGAIIQVKARDPRPGRLARVFQ